ncbi:fibronectin type III domain-containing protein [Effusibacillus lacus]
MHDSEGVRALNLWNQIMDRVYKKFPQQGEFPGMPGGIIRSEFCTKSGKIPTDLCRAANTVSSDLFVAGTEPKEPCDVHVKVKYAEINGKKYMVDDKVTALGGVVKEGIFIKREPYTLPYNNPKYKPLDADLELPEEFGKDDKDKNKNDNSPSVLGLKVMESRLDAITIGWEPVQGAEGYVVLRATSPAGPFAVLSELVTTNSYKDTAVQAGTTYYYQISVIANGSIQPAKDALEAVPGMLGGGKLQPPTGVTVVSTPVGITVSWQPAAGATQYLVYRSYDGSSFELITVVSGTGYQDVTAQGSNVWYKVSAKNEAEQSAMSAPVKAGSGTQGDSLSAPLLTAEKTESGNVQLSWNSVPGAVRYQIERHSGSSWQEITEVTGTQYTDTELNQNTAYSYRVYAVNATGQKSPVSNVVKVQP